MYGQGGPPWGMIQARRERDELSRTLWDLKQTVLTAVEDALAEMEKPHRSKAKVKDILRTLQVRLTQP